MSGYLTQEIAQVIPMLTQSCEDLIRQELIRALTVKTQEWCEGDPELAELILDKKKSLEGCVRYVMGKAAEFIAKTVSAMTQEEVDALPKQTINGRTATMAGGAVGEDKAYEWAKDYYYTAKESDHDVKKAIADAKANAGNKAAKNTSGKKAAAKSTGKTKSEPQAGVDTPEAQGKDDRPEQMSMFAA